MKTVKVDLPEDRCRAGKITFGAVNGKIVTCSALGRGVTRWSSTRPPAQRVEYLKGQYVDTVPSDWQHGSGCWFLKANKKGGATPKGTYAVTGYGGRKTKWGSINSLSMYLRPPRDNRSAFVIHTDNRFKGAARIESRTHSTSGCLKLDPQCQPLILQFYKEHGAFSMVID